MSYWLLLNLLMIALLLGLSLRIIVNARSRSALDVILDLQNEDGNRALPGGFSGKELEKSLRNILSCELGSSGLLGQAGQAHYALRQRVTPLALAAVFCILGFFWGPSGFARLCFFPATGLALGYLFERWQLHKRQEAFVREIEFFLPLVMERIVMAVRSGLDVIAALKVIVALEQPQDRRRGPARVDPVTRLLDMVCQLAEAGLSFEEAIKSVASMVNCTALRHAFLHLAMAYREGGELVMPLSELSDSTQLYFQESIEEQIARMPVKATMPLVLTFAGLLVCFITAPLIQVMEVLSQALPK